MGEVIRGDYKRTVREMHLSTVTQYELRKGIWSSLNDDNFFELAHALKRHAEFSQHFPPWTFVGNHDTTHIATQLSHPRHLGHALAVLFTVPGIPAVYAGKGQGALGRKYDRAGGDADRIIMYEVRANAGRMVVALSTDDKAARCKVPPDLIPVAGHPDAELRPSTWGVWATP